MEPEGLGLPPGLGAPSRARVLFMSQEGREQRLGAPVLSPQTASQRASQDSCVCGSCWSLHAGSLTSPSPEVHGEWWLSHVILMGSQGKWHLEINMTQERTRASQTYSLSGSLAHSVVEHR